MARPERGLGTAAQRHADVERALQPCALSRATVGSRAWGVASPEAWLLRVRLSQPSA